MCPACNSPAISEAKGVLDDECRCRSCGHEAPRKAFPVHVFKTNFPLDDKDLLQRMADTLAQRVMSVAAPELGRWLVDWGFAWWGSSAPRDSRDYAFRCKVVARYARAAGKGMVLGFLEARNELEKERLEHERDYPPTHS